MTDEIPAAFRNGPPPAGPIFERSELADALAEALQRLQPAAPPEESWLQKYSPLLFGLVVAAFTLVGNAQLDQTRKQQDAIDRRSTETESRTLDSAAGLRRLADRIDAADARDRDLLAGWSEWRKGVDAGLREARDGAVAASANQASVEQLLQRMTRLSEIVQDNNRDTSAKLARFAVDLSRIGTLVEGGRRGEAPFGNNRSEDAPNPRGPLVRAAGLGGGR